MKKKNAKKVLIAVLLVLAIAASAFAGWEYYLDREENRLRAEAAENASLLIAQRGEIMKELEELEEAYEAEVLVRANCQLIFWGADTQIYCQAYPALEALQIQGLLVFTPEDLPGAPNCMTMEEFQELTDMGWEYCVAYSNVEGWHDYMNESLIHIGLEMPKTIYFPKGTYSHEMLPYMQDVDCVIHHGEEGLPLLAGSPDGIWEVGTVGMPAGNDAINQLFNDVLTNVGEVTLTMAPDLGDNTTEILAELTEMLLHFQSAGVQFNSLSEARAMRSIAPSELEQLEQKHMAAAEELQAKIDALTEEIDAVYNSVKY